MQIRNMPIRFKYTGIPTSILITNSLYSSLEDFRADIIASTTSSSQLMAVSYSRSALGQTGSGHFSPIGGYSSYNGGYALVLDVARFKYPSYWVPLEALYGSLTPVDPVTKQPRGYSLLRKPDVGAKVDDGKLLLKLEFTKATWPGWFAGLAEAVAVLKMDATFEEVTTVVGSYVSEKEQAVGTRTAVLKMAADSLSTTPFPSIPGHPVIPTQTATSPLAPTANTVAAYDPTQTVHCSQEYSVALTSFLTHLSTSNSSLYHLLPAFPANTPTSHALTTILLLTLYSFPAFLEKVPCIHVRRKMEEIAAKELDEDEVIHREVVGLRRQMAGLETCSREECGCGKGICARKGLIYT